MWLVSLALQDGVILRGSLEEKQVHESYIMMRINEVLAGGLGSSFGFCGCPCSSL
jgi:hypothetical protein